MAVVRMGVIGAGSQEGDKARRTLPMFLGYEKPVVLVNASGSVLVNADGAAYAYLENKQWDK